MNRSLYERLGLEPTASFAEIKQAFRAVAKRHHPDRGGDPDRFVAMTQAYNVLSDPDRRRRYDDTGVYDAEAADNSQRDLVVTLSSALNLVLSRSKLAIESTDFVAEMRKIVATGRDVIGEELADIEARLTSLQAARERIRRKDEAENLFLLVIDGQIKTLTEAQIGKRKVKDAQDRALEELERYDSVVEIIRTVQSGLPAGAVAEPAGAR